MVKESCEESSLLWWHMLLWTNLWAILDGISGPSRLDNSNLGLGVVGNGLKAFNNTSGRRFQKEPAHMEFNSKKGLVYWWYLFWLWQKTQPNEKKFYKKHSGALWLQARMKTGAQMMSKKHLTPASVSLCLSPIFLGESVLKQAGYHRASPTSSQAQPQWERKLYIWKLNTEVSELRTVASSWPGKFSLSHMLSSKLIAEVWVMSHSPGKGGAFSSRPVV